MSVYVYIHTHISKQLHYQPVQQSSAYQTVNKTTSGTQSHRHLKQVPGNICHPGRRSGGGDRRSGLCGSPCGDRHGGLL